MATAQQPGGPNLYGRIDSNRQQVGQVLIGVALLLGAAAIFLGFRYGWDWAPLIAGLLVFAVGALGAGAWYLGGAAEGLSGADSARLLVLILGGWLGFSLVQATIWGV